MSGQAEHSDIKEMPTGAVGIRQLLKDPTFGLYTLGQFCAQIGFWTMQIATGWLAWQLTQSETWLGIIAFAQFAPTAFLGLYAGAVADRYNRLTIILTVQAAVFLLLLSLFVLGVLGELSVVRLAGLILCLGTAQTFALPAMRAFVSQIVAKENLPRAISLNSITVNIARFTGPSIAGGLIWLDHLEFAFLVSASLSAVFLFILTRIKLRHAVQDLAEKEPGKINAMIIEGLNAARTHQGVAALLGLYTVYAFLGRPFVDLLPAIVTSLLQGGAPTLAMLTITFALSAIVIGVVLAGLSNSKLLWRTLAPSCLVMALGMVIVIMFGSQVFAIAGVALYGLAQVTINVSTLTLSQLLVEDRMRGRIGGLHFLIFRSGAAFGSLGLGALAEQIGLVATFLGAAFIVGVIGGGLSFVVGQRNR